MKRIVIIACACVAFLAACSRTEPLEVSAAPSVSPGAAPVSDQAVIADVVGRGTVGTKALAWANPSTGSAGVIEQIDTHDRLDGCRGFVTSRQSLEGTTRFGGVVCPSGNSWKLGATTH
nr:RT0821/Lpp0805 family surface protein [Rhizobium aethiopicum]